jgi:tetratricopeptide (TPR) repeat protein
MYLVATFRQSSKTLRKAGREVMTLASQMNRPQLAVEASAALALADHADEHCDAALERFRAATQTPPERPGMMMSLSAIVLYHAGDHREAVALNRYLLPVARDMDDYWATITIWANLALSLAALGQYQEARECFAEGRALARQRGVQTLDVRTASMSTGPYVDIFDYAGAAAAARETCALGEKLEFPTPRISALIDLAFVAVRTGDPNHAADLLDSIAATVQKGTGWHGWIWRERVGVARAEIDLARGDYANALRRAETSIEECGRHHRMKYVAAAQVVRADARAALGARDEALVDLARFLDELGPDRDPPIRLRIGAALVKHAPDERARDIALAAAATIEAGLPRADAPAFRAQVDAMLAPRR